MSRVSGRFVSIALAIAVVVTIVNAVLFVTGVRWAGGVIEDVSRDSENESLLLASERVESAERAVDRVLGAGLWVAAFVAVVLTVVAFHRLGRGVRRRREADAIGSYLHNAARARHEAQRRRRHTSGVTG